MNTKNTQINGKRKVVKLSATFFILTLFFTACKKDSNIGDSLQSENLDLIVVDTFSLITYSEEVDSMETDETSVNLLGYYNDPVFGSVDCGIVTQLRLSSPDPDLKTGQVIAVDSVVLALQFTTINYYANLDDITVEVYEINDDLVRADQDYYSFTQPTITGGNLVDPAKATITPDFVSNQQVGSSLLSPQVRIHLDTTLGQHMRDLGDAGSLINDASFVDAFKGLYVKVDGSSFGSGDGTVLSFVMESAISNVTMYFKNSLGESQYYTFNINSAAARYNTIAYDRTGTNVDAQLNDASLGQQEFYMQGSAIWGVIKFPYIDQLYKDSDGNPAPKIINRAELLLPVIDETDTIFDPPTTMFIARIVDSKTSDFTLDYSFQSTLNGNTVTYNEDKQYYSFVMTREIQAILNGEIENKGYRIYIPSFYGSSIERCVFKGGSATENRAKLIITYTEY